MFNTSSTTSGIIGRISAYPCLRLLLRARGKPNRLIVVLTSIRSVVKNPSICKGETPRSIVYAPQEVAGHARSAKTEGQHVSDGDHRGACAQRPFPATAGYRGGLFVHSSARSPFVL